MFCRFFCVFCLAFPHTNKASSLPPPLNATEFNVLKEFHSQKRSRNFRECVCACVRLFMCKIKRGKTDAAVVTTTSNPTTFHYHHPHYWQTFRTSFFGCRVPTEVACGCVWECERSKGRKSHRISWPPSPSFILSFCSLIFPATPLALHCFFSSILSLHRDGGQSGMKMVFTDGGWWWKCGCELLMSGGRAEIDAPTLMLWWILFLLLFCST